MKKIAMFIAFLCLIGMQLVNAQQKQITGKVTSSEDGLAIPGVSVLVKGTTIGTSTNIDGEYSLGVPGDAEILVFSFVGMKAIEVTIGTKTTINVVMEPEAIGVEEVVVTALGVTRAKKSLGYAVQEVKGDEINTVKSDNFVTALSGKVSGVQIKNTTNFGGSSNVVIRGSSSLTQSNQAMFVVDGIPIDNANTNNAGQLSGRSGYDYGNGAADINPNDIESVSVLKGAAATALYGSRAANGVILITTKKGKATKGKQLDVRLSSNFTFSRIDKETFPEYQHDYGGGYDPTWYSHPDYPGLDIEDVDGDGVGDPVVPYYEDASRGQAFDPNLLVYQWDAFDPESPNFGKKTPFVPSSNGPDSFFKTGLSKTNSIDVSGGSESTTYRFSYTNMDQSGVMPNSSLKRHNFIFNGTHKILDNLKITSQANYINTHGKGRPSTGYSDNIMSSFRQWIQVGLDFNMLEKLYKQTGRNITWNRKYYDNPIPAYWDNPYWVRFENYEEDFRDRLIGYVQLDWKITDYLNAMGRASIDTYSELQEENKAVGSVSGEFGVGRPDVTSGYARRDRSFRETNIDFMLNFHKKFNEDLDLSALLGANIRRSKEEDVYTSTNGGLAVPGTYALSNSVDPMLPPEEFLNEIGVNGIFASGSVGYKDTYYLDATIRRDESSTLPSDNRTYYYPSVTTSVIFSNLLNLSWMTMGKFRLNYAEVGNDAPPRRVKDTYVGNAPFSGNSLVTVPNTKNNANLKPEHQKAWETGLDMNFFNNRAGFDLALYKNNTTNQLVPVSVSFATGYSAKWVNAGEIENKGIELSLFGTPVKTNDWRWDLRVNWSKNTNKVISLFVDEAGNEVTNLQLASLQGGISINARVGEPYGTIQGSDFVYHENGSKIITNTGSSTRIYRYAKTATNDQVIGNVNPDWNAGITNTINYKNLSLSFLIDVQKGGDVFSLDMWYGTGTGLYKETAGLNDLGNPKRNELEDGGGVILEGVYEDGTPNTQRIRSDIYTEGWVRSPNARFVYDASFVKLRELSLTYNFPKKLLGNTFIKEASLSFVGTNLWIIHKNLPYADPEASQSSGNIQGWQSGVMPTNRNFGFTANLRF